MIPSFREADQAREQALAQNSLIDYRHTQTFLEKDKKHKEVFL